MTRTAYLSLGSNLGDREANLRAAIEGLEALGEIVAVSSIYETEPVDTDVPQPQFLNGIVALYTNWLPERLLSGVLAIEASLGRRREQQKGPRTVDIDIVLFNGLIIDARRLTIPHPAMHRRRFVLEPLAEIAPELRHPVLKRTVAELLASLPADQGVVRKIG